MSRLDYVERVGKNYLDKLGISAKEYVTQITSPSFPLDLLAMFLIARLYRFHIVVTFHTGAFFSDADRNYKKALFTLVYKAGDYFCETCKMGQSGEYFQSLVDKTNASLMPSHCPDIKITLSEDEIQEVPDPKLHIKLEFKHELPPEHTKQWSSTFSIASKLLNKAKKERMRASIKKEQKTQIHNLIFSGGLHPADIAQEARKGHKMINVDCDVCAVKCRSLREYVQHMTDKHPDHIFRCTVCGRGYRSYNGKYKHEKQHFGTKFVCMICGRAFKVKDSLNKHLPVHNPESKQYCDTCGKGFASKSSLKCHQNIHLDLSIPCPDCAKTFAAPDHMQHHWRGFHGEGYTTRCKKFTYQWPGKCQRHQKSCKDCTKILQLQEAENFPDLRV